jgi:hypothetical protein
VSDEIVKAAVFDDRVPIINPEPPGLLIVTGSIDVIPSFTLPNATGLGE